MKNVSKKNDYFESPKICAKRLVSSDDYKSAKHDLPVQPRLETMHKPESLSEKYTVKNVSKKNDYFESPKIRAKKQYYRSTRLVTVVSSDDYNFQVPKMICKRSSTCTT